MARVGITRRAALTAISGAVPVIVGAHMLEGKAMSQESLPRPRTADEALERLLEGNRLFVAGKSSHPRTDLSWRAALRHQQEPFATILGCSDSRVPPELIFDQGLGDLFVVRLAGNVVGPGILGSIKFSILNLHTRLVMVLGHEKCGAVSAALDVLDGKSHGSEAIEALLKMISPGLHDLPKALKGEERVHAAVEANVRWSLKQLGELPLFKNPGAEGTARLVGAMYNLESGEVRVLA
jgi:carbonic anhydrase